MSRRAELRTDPAPRVSVVDRLSAREWRPKLWTSANSGNAVLCAALAWNQALGAVKSRPPTSKTL
jgi:hypothetical protein